MRIASISRLHIAAVATAALLACAWPLAEIEAGWAVEPSKFPTEWQYRSCTFHTDSFGQSQECGIIQGGTWERRPGEYYAYCYGGKVTLDGILAKAAKFEETLHQDYNEDVACSGGVGTWVDWLQPGQTREGWGCSDGPPRIDGWGVETWNLARIDVKQTGGGAGCTSSFADPVHIVRNRKTECPSGYYDNGITCTMTDEGVPFKNNQCGISNPVHIGMGYKQQVENDLEIEAAGGQTLDFTRYYIGSSTVRDNIGERWRHTYSRQLERVHWVGPDYVLDTIGMTRPNGSRFFFNHNPDGSWQSDGDVHDVLEDLPTGGWRYATTNNTIEEYGPDKKLLSITDARGNVQTVSHDSAGRIARIETNTGEYLQFDYTDATSSVASISDHAGRVWNYAYDPRGNLEYVIYPDATPSDDADNPRRRYHYEDPIFIDALTGITDERALSDQPNQRYATYGYDDQMRVVLSTHADGVQKLEVSYSDTDRTRAITNSLGQPSIYDTEVSIGVARTKSISGPGCSTCGAADTSYTYHAPNNLASETRNGVTTRYGLYDSRGQMGCKTEGITAADTSAGDCAFDPTASPDARRTDYTYDARFYQKIASITEPSVFPGNSKVTSYAYDAYANVTSETVSGFDAAGNAISRATTHEYNGPLNQLSFVNGPRTDINDFTWYRYYPNDPTQLSNRARLKEIEDASGTLIRSNIQYTATGKVQSEQRPNGLALSYTYYPGNDRLETLTEIAPTGTRQTRWTYLATGEVESITTANGTADATTLTFGYDAARRMTRITDGLGNSIAYVLDTEGNLREQNTLDSSNALRRQILQTFDTYNRLDTSGQANESVDLDFAPDGTLDVQTDGRGSVTDYDYDALKRLTQATQNLGGADPATANTTTAYGYDTQDRLTSVTDPVNGNTTYAYDDLGNLLSQTSPDTGTTTYQYDTAGNLIQKTDAMGQVFTYGYDSLKRVTAVDAPGSEHDVTYSYDICLNGAGRLCAVQYGNGALPNGNSVRYQYNAYGDITGHNGLRYNYDTAGRVATVHYPSGARLDY
ncbi:MAG: DUF6531 domain-containing protein, partial [Thiogranum sp.]|nr:DUF6531 domain-containing protein [Thiogranum sp.]